jgi:hypothetical protein
MVIGSTMVKVYEYARKHAGVTMYELARDGIRGNTIKGGYSAINRARVAGLVFLQLRADGAREVFAVAYQNMGGELALALAAWYTLHADKVPPALLRRAELHQEVLRVKAEAAAAPVVRAVRR